MLNQLCTPACSMGTTLLAHWPSTGAGLCLQIARAKHPTLWLHSSGRQSARSSALDRQVCAPALGVMLSLRVSASVTKLHGSTGAAEATRAADRVSEAFAVLASALLDFSATRAASTASLSFTKRLKRGRTRWINLNKAHVLRPSSGTKFSAD